MAVTDEQQNTFVGAEAPFIEAREAKLSLQPSIKRDRAKLYSPNSSFTPVPNVNKDKGSVAGDLSKEGERKTSTSILSIDVRSDSITAPNEVSVFEGDLKPAASSMHSDDDSLEVIIQKIYNGNSLYRVLI